jgi:hypothetical protein
MTKYMLDDLYNDTFIFNDLAGNTSKLSLNDVKNQLLLIQEEVAEIAHAVDTNNPIELLDGVVDTYYVLNGLTSKLIALGFDVSTALKQTAENNLSKFPSDEYIAIESQSAYDLHDNIKVDINYNDSHQRWVIKDQNGKVRKPVGFVGNDLSNCLPSGFDKFKE